MTFRTLHSLTFRVPSPSVYELVGWPLTIYYILDGEIKGWIVCEDDQPLHRRPFGSANEAAWNLSMYLARAKVS